MTQPFLKKTILIISLLLSFFALQLSSVKASSKDTFEFKSRVLDQDGVPLDDGNYNFKFIAYSSGSGGSPLWSEDDLGVQLRRGTFSVNLGQLNPFPPTLWTDYPDLYIQICFDANGISGDGVGACGGRYEEQFSPRKKITAVPFAERAFGLGPTVIPDGGVGYSIISQGGSGSIAQFLADTNLRFDLQTTGTMSLTDGTNTILLQPGLARITLPATADIFFGTSSLRGTGNGTSGAGLIGVSTTNFNNNLNSSDNTVQKALDTIDNLTLGSSCPSCFVNNGNSFGGLATLGTTDNQSLAFITNNAQRLILSNTSLLSSVPVGIGNNTGFNPSANLLSLTATGSSLPSGGNYNGINLVQQYNPLADNGTQSVNGLYISSTINFGDGSAIGVGRGIRNIVSSSGSGILALYGYSGGLTNNGGTDQMLGINQTVVNNGTSPVGLFRVVNLTGTNNATVTDRDGAYILRVTNNGAYGGGDSRLMDVGFTNTATGTVSNFYGNNFETANYGVAGYDFRNFYNVIQNSGTVGRNIINGDYLLSNPGTAVGVTQINSIVNMGAITGDATGFNNDFGVVGSAANIYGARLGLSTGFAGSFQAAQNIYGYASTMSGNINAAGNIYGVYNNLNTNSTTTNIYGIYNNVQSTGTYSASYGMYSTNGTTDLYLNYNNETALYVNTGLSRFAPATANIASINIANSSGTNPTTPNSGDLWWNGTNLYFNNGAINVDLLASLSGACATCFVDNGNAFGGQATLGTTDNNSLRLITNNTTALIVDTNQDLTGSGRLALWDATPGTDSIFRIDNSTRTQTSGDLSPLYITATNDSTGGKTYGVRSVINTGASNNPGALQAITGEVNYSSSASPGALIQGIATNVNNISASSSISAIGGTLEVTNNSTGASNYLAGLRAVTANYGNAFNSYGATFQNTQYAGGSVADMLGISSVLENQASGGYMSGISNVVNAYSDVDGILGSSTLIYAGGNVSFGITGTQTIVTGPGSGYSTPYIYGSISGVGLDTGTVNGDVAGMYTYVTGGGGAVTGNLIGTLSSISGNGVSGDIVAFSTTMANSATNGNLIGESYNIYSSNTIGTNIIGSTIGVSGAYTTNDVIGYQFNFNSIGATLNNLYGAKFTSMNGSASNSQYGIYIGNADRGVINNYGLYLAGAAGGSGTNAALWVNAGLSRFAPATTGQASVNIADSAGTDPSTPNSGDLWWNGTNLYFHTASVNYDLLTGGGGCGGTCFSQNGNAFGTTAVLGTTDGNDLSIITNGAEAIHISAAGDVGIGTNTPSYPLHVLKSFSGSDSFVGGVFSNVNNFGTISAFQTAGNFSTFNSNSTTDMWGIYTSSTNNGTASSIEAIDGYVQNNSTVTGDIRNTIQTRNVGTASYMDTLNLMSWNQTGGVLNGELRGIYSEVTNDGTVNNFLYGSRTEIGAGSGASSWGMTGTYEHMVNGAGDSTGFMTGDLNYLINSSTVSGDLVGYQPQVVNETTGTANNMYGTLFELENKGTVQAMYGIEVNMTTSGGTANDAYGMHISTIDSGTNNNYGLYIQGANSGTNNYALYVQSGVSRFAPGNTNFASINLPVGIDPTTPNSGDLWWNGTNLYFNNGSTNIDLLTGGGGCAGTCFNQNGNAFGTTAVLGTTDNNNLNFITNNTQYMTITNTGRVGMGTNTPQGFLDITNPGGSGGVPTLRLTSSQFGGENIFSVYDRGRATYDSYANGTALTLIQHNVSNNILDIGNGAGTQILVDQYGDTQFNKTVAIGTTPMPQVKLAINADYSSGSNYGTQTTLSNTGGVANDIYGSSTEINVTNSVNNLVIGNQVNMTLDAAAGSMIGQYINLVNNTNTDAYSASFYNLESSTSTAPTQTGIFNVVNNQSNSAVTNVTGIKNYVSASGISGSVQDLIGIDSTPEAYYSVTNAYGFRSSPQVGNGSVPTTLDKSYGFYAASPVVSAATLNDNYGMYVENQTSGSNSNYGLYIAGAGTAQIHIDRSAGTGIEFGAGAASGANDITTSDGVLNIAGDVTMTGVCSDSNGGDGGADGCDIAETFASDTTLAKGELVMLQSGAGNSNWKKITRTASHSDAAIGIISTKPTVLMGNNAFAGSTGYPVGLAGVLPTKVINQNGMIKRGDYITTSDTAGMGMKASDGDRTIGIALEDQTTSQDTINVLVSRNNTAVNNTNKLDNLQAAFDNLKGQLDIAKINAAISLSDLIMAKDGVVVIAGKLDVSEIVAQTITAKQANVEGISVTSDKAGSLTLAKGETTIAKTITGLVATTDKVLVTPTTSIPAGVGYYVQKTNGSFSIILTNAADVDLTFDYVVIE